MSPLFPLVGLSVVQMKSLYIKGRVGESVTISCSDWNVWPDVTENVKYFCFSPCEDQHIISKAEYEKIHTKNGIKLHNNGKTLLVTFKSLQKSDSKTYYCGVERTGLFKDAYIRVILNVLDALPSSPRMTPKTITVVPTSSFAVTTSSTMSSNSSDVFTETSTSHTTLKTTTPAAPAQGSDSSVLYLVVGVTGVLVVITILMVSLKLMNMMMKRRSKVVSGADTVNTEPQQDAAYEEIRLEDQTDPDALYCNHSDHQVNDLLVERPKEHSDVLYLNQAASFMDSSKGAFRKSERTLHSVYSVVKSPKELIDASVQSERKEPEINEEDSLYSLAQLPRAT
ncbi:CMRF35-like molecule 1 [Pungitius pungitius]|uniref:CMRF35-like molecule 1 n=1 Tax=Pungitius pungitius TaxID=134920 RepID=UPI002E1390A0